MNKKSFFLKMLIVIFMTSVGAYYYPELPDKMPIHWNYAGVADNFAPKEKAILIFPGIALIMLILFQILPKLDPKKENYPKFEKAWEAFQFSFLIFFAYAFCLTIIATLHMIDIGRYMMLGLGFLFIVLGNYMGKIRRNYFVGIRLPWTIDNEDVWNKTHRLGGKMFMLAGLLFILNSFIKVEAPLLFIASVISVIFLPIIYSYLIFRRLSTTK